MSNAKTFHLAGVEMNTQYVVIWGVLLGLTLVEVLIPEMSWFPGQHVAWEASVAAAKEAGQPVPPADTFFGVPLLPRDISIMLLISLAIIKTYCVAWFYMHLVDERPLLVLIASTPFIFSVFLTIGLFPWAP